MFLKYRLAERVNLAEHMLYVWPDGFGSKSKTADAGE